MERELSDFDKVAVITVEKLKKYILTHQKWAADLCINALDADELWEWLSHSDQDESDQDKKDAWPTRFIINKKTLIA